MALGVRKREKENLKPLPTRYFSNKQEKAVAETIGGKCTSNSGATDFGGKADVFIDNLISIECKTKTTSSKSLSIKKDWLDKLKAEATIDGHEYSALAFNFGPEEEMHYIINEYLFLDLLQYIKNKDKFDQYIIKNEQENINKIN